MTDVSRVQSTAQAIQANVEKVIVGKSSVVELMIAVAVFSVVGIMLALLLTAAARVGQRSSLYMRSEMKARDVLDRMRSRLLVAEFTTVSIQPTKTVGGKEIKQIDFVDPVTVIDYTKTNPAPANASVHFRFSRGKDSSTGIYSGTLEYWLDNPVPGNSVRTWDNWRLEFTGLYDVEWNLVDRLENPTLHGPVLRFSVLCPAQYIRIEGSTPTVEEQNRMQILKLTDEVTFRNPIPAS